MGPTLWRCALAAGLGLLLLATAQATEQRLSIPPQQTDERLSDAEPPHLVVYDTEAVAAPPLLVVWLGGTGGKPASGPRLFYDTVLRQGHRLLALSYLNLPAVSQVCVGPRLRARPGCAGAFRQHRVWGEPVSDLVSDRPEDAIVPRLTRLLRHLVQNDPAGQWAPYLDGDAPRWERLVLAGQSQGGGMAAYIAQTRPVAGVIMFSGGWDRRSADEIADWYLRPPATPLQRWHGTYHVQEPQAPAMDTIYRRLGLPATHIHALAEPVRGANPHGEGISNPAYQALWVQMMGSAGR